MIVLGQESPISRALQEAGKTVNAFCSWIALFLLLAAAIFLFIKAFQSHYGDTMLRWTVWPVIGLPPLLVAGIGHLMAVEWAKNLPSWQTDGIAHLASFISIPIGITLGALDSTDSHSLRDRMCSPKEMRQFLGKLAK